MIRDSNGRPSLVGQTYHDCSTFWSIPPETRPCLVEKLRSNYSVNRSILKLADDQEDGSNGPSLSGDFLEMQSMAVMGGAASCPELVDAERRASAGNF